MTEAETLADTLGVMNYQPRVIQEAAALLRSQAAEIESLRAQVTTQHDVLMRKDREIEALKAAIKKLHAANGRYHTQIAACDLFDMCNLKNERPTK